MSIAISGAILGLLTVALIVQALQRAPFPFPSGNVIFAVVVVILVRGEEPAQKYMQGAGLLLAAVFLWLELSQTIRGKSRKDSSA